MWISPGRTWESSRLKLSYFPYTLVGTTEVKEHPSGYCCSYALQKNNTFIKSHFGILFHLWELRKINWKVKLFTTTVIVLQVKPIQWCLTFDFIMSILKWLVTWLSSVQLIQKLHLFLLLITSFSQPKGKLY